MPLTIPTKVVVLTYRAGTFNLAGHPVTLRVHERLAGYPLPPPPEGLIAFLAASPIRAQGYLLASPLALLREGPDRFSIIANPETYAVLTNLPHSVPALEVPALVLDLPPELISEVVRASGLYSQIYPGSRGRQIARWPNVPDLVKELCLNHKAFAKFLGLPENLYYYFRKQGNQPSTTAGSTRKQRPKHAKHPKTGRPPAPRLRPANRRAYIGIGQLTLPFVPSKGAGQ